MRTKSRKRKTVADEYASGINLTHKDQPILFEHENAPRAYIDRANR